MVTNHNNIIKSNNGRVNEKLSILRFLIENSEEDYSIRKIALARRINYKSAYKVVKKLGKEGIVNVKKYGNASIVKFNYNFNESVFIVENQRKEDFLKNKDFKVLYKRIMEIKNPFFICLIFGSYAKGTARKGSDLDLCVITNEKEVKSEISAILDITPFDIHYLEFSSDDFIKMLKTTEFNVGREIVKNKIILKGIEEFYELIDHAKWKKNKRSWN